jgi:hypothetical protein
VRLSADDSDAFTVTEVLVVCPSCGARATIATQAGSVRLTCTSCGLAKTSEHGTPASHLFASRSSAFRTYNGTSRPFDARLWLEDECCSGRRLWALNGAHLDYLEAFVTSTRRERDFPSPPGRRQLADKLPAWLTQRKHRDEILHGIAEMRARI